MALLALILTVSFKGCSEYNRAADHEPLVEARKVIDETNKTNVQLQQQLTEARKVIEGDKKTIETLQQRLANAKNVAQSSPRAPVALTVPQRPSTQPTPANVDGQSVPKTESGAKLIAPTAEELKDSIKDMERRIRSERANLAIARNLARDNTSNPNWNIQMRVQLKEVEDGIGEMGEKLVKMKAQLREISPPPVPPVVIVDTPSTPAAPPDNASPPPVPPKK